MVPIHDLGVRFSPSFRLGRVHLEPGGQELPVTATAEGSRVTVPKLEVHAMVVAELAQ